MKRRRDHPGATRADPSRRRWLGCLCRVRQRYDRVAPFYDAAMVVERLFFPQARGRAVELLRLEVGQTVVDVGCGSGRNLPLLRRGVGASGEIIAIDWSPKMLDAARERAVRSGWSNVRFVRADAATLTREVVETYRAARLDGGADAALCTFALSVIPQWERAYEAMVGLVKRGGRVVVADVGLSPEPEPGERIVLRGLWRLACRITKAAGQRRPWLLLGVGRDVVEHFGAGYVGVAAATVAADGLQLAGWSRRNDVVDI